MNRKSLGMGLFILLGAFAFGQKERKPSLVVYEPIEPPPLPEADDSEGSDDSREQESNARIRAEQERLRRQKEAIDADKARDDAEKKAKTKAKKQEAERGFLPKLQEARDKQVFFGVIPSGSLVKVLEEKTKDFLSLLVKSAKVANGKPKSYTGTITNVSDPSRLALVGKVIPFKPAHVFGHPGLAEDAPQAPKKASPTQIAKKGREIGAGLVLEPRGKDFSESLTRVGVGFVASLNVQNPKPEEFGEDISVSITKIVKENASSPRDTLVQGIVTKAPGFTRVLLNQSITFTRGDIGQSFEP